MTGRPLINEARGIPVGYYGPEASIRRRVLRDTLARFDTCPMGDRYRGCASENLAKWRSKAEISTQSTRVLVMPDDWGVATLKLTQQYGRCFAVLNMANAYVPGGAYVEGAVAQEENIYRRTDCHFYIGPPDYDAARDRYTSEATRLISGVDGYVYLDSKNPRVCIRGPEDREADHLGYPWLQSDEIFPFYELKAAAQDLRQGDRFNPELARMKIQAQLNTLQREDIKHVVFGAFGCGAFQNPVHEIARIYSEEIAKVKEQYSVIAFAIYHAGYGPRNYEPFAAVLNAT